MFYFERRTEPNNDVLETLWFQSTAPYLVTNHKRHDLPCRTDTLIFKLKSTSKV
jgi:hypothetical protein